MARPRARKARQGARTGATHPCAAPSAAQSPRGVTRYVTRACARVSARLRRQGCAPEAHQERARRRVRPAHAGTAGHFPAAPAARRSTPAPEGVTGQNVAARARGEWAHALRLRTRGAPSQQRPPCATPAATGLLGSLPRALRRYSSHCAREDAITACGGGVGARSDRARRACACVGGGTGAPQILFPTVG